MTISVGKFQLKILTTDLVIVKFRSLTLPIAKGSGEWGKFLTLSDAYQQTLGKYSEMSAKIAFAL